MVVSGETNTNQPSTYKGISNTVRKYYKYVEQSWTQPTFTHNNIIVDNFCAYNYYNCFLPNTSQLSIYRDENRGWVECYMYSPLGIIPKQFTFYCVENTDASSPAYNVKFYGTNEDWVMDTPIPTGCSSSTRSSINTGAWAEAWDTIGTSANVGENKTGTIDMSTNTKSYKWFRFEASSNGSAYNDRLTLKKFNLSGTQRTIVESTSSDYDFYIDEPLRSVVVQDFGTKTGSNYLNTGFFRPNVTSDTITFKKDANYSYYTNTSNGTISNTKTGVRGNVDITKAFNPTLGQYRVRPVSATFISTTVSSQWTTCRINAWLGDANQSWEYGTRSLSTGFDGATKGTYDITWNNTPPFQYWWTFTPVGFGYQSGTQTLAGTLTNIVWEVENTNTNIPDIRYYVVT